jgi:two-component system chemotaxis response regulator CheB
VADEGGNRVIKLNQNPPENFCRPAADPMLRSLVEVYGSRLFVAVLTGMGSDGFKGCQVVVEKGGAVISQDEATSVVWGMPAAVAEGGLCHAVLPIDQLGPYISNVAKRGSV